MTGLLLLSVFGYQYMRQGFFPDMVYDQLYMEYKLPEGNNYTRVVRDLEEIETYLKNRDIVRHSFAEGGNAHISVAKTIPASGVNKWTWDVVALQTQRHPISRHSAGGIPHRNTGTAVGNQR